jgi:hypothetical protein
MLDSIGLEDRETWGVQVSLVERGCCHPSGLGPVACKVSLAHRLPRKPIPLSTLDTRTRLWEPVYLSGAILIGRNATAQAQRTAGLRIAEL